MNIVSGNNLHISSEGNIFDTKNKNQENDKDSKTFQFNLNTSSEKTSFEKSKNSDINNGAKLDLEKENQSKLCSFNATEQSLQDIYPKDSKAYKKEMLKKNILDMEL